MLRVFIAFRLRVLLLKVVAHGEYCYYDIMTFVMGITMRSISEAVLLHLSKNLLGLLP